MATFYKIKDVRLWIIAIHKSIWDMRYHTSVRLGLMVLLVILWLLYKICWDSWMLAVVCALVGSSPLVPRGERSTSYRRWSRRGRSLPTKSLSGQSAFRRCAKFVTARLFVSPLLFAMHFGFMPWWLRTPSTISFADCANLMQAIRERLDPKLDTSLTLIFALVCFSVANNSIEFSTAN